MLAMPPRARDVGRHGGRLEGVEALVTELDIACDWRRSGHLELADHPRHVSHLRSVADAYASIAEDARFVGPDELGAEVGSSRFAGGLLVTRSGSVHRPNGWRGLARAALAAGAELHGHTEAVGRQPRGSRVPPGDVAGTIRAAEWSSPPTGPRDADRCRGWAVAFSVSAAS